MPVLPEFDKTVSASCPCLADIISFFLLHSSSKLSLELIVIKLVHQENSLLSHLKDKRFCATSQASFAYLLVRHSDSFTRSFGLLSA